MEDSFKILREQGKSELLEILDSLRGRKCIVLDNFLGRLLTEIVFEDDIQIMKENNVQQYDISSKNLPEVLENDLGRELPDNICYLIRADFSMTKAVARHVRDCFRAGKIHTLKIHNTSTSYSLIQKYQTFRIYILYMKYFEYVNNKY